MKTRTFIRAPAFDSIADLLSWSESHGAATPKVEQGPDSTFRGSVEVAAIDDNTVPGGSGRKDT